MVPRNLGTVSTIYINNFYNAKIHANLNTYSCALSLSLKFINGKLYGG